MKIAKCPRCHKKSGFLAFRKVQRGDKQYPYVCHYDKRKYEKQKIEYLSGRQKSKPSGRKCCNIRLFDTMMMDFVGDWFLEYLKIIRRIHSKYYKFGFMNKVELKIFLEDPPGNLMLERKRKEFAENKHWNEDWKYCEQLLRKAGYLLDPRIRIMKDIFFRIEWGSNRVGHKNAVLGWIFLD